MKNKTPEQETKWNKTKTDLELRLHCGTHTISTCNSHQVGVYCNRSLHGINRSRRSN